MLEDIGSRKLVTYENFAVIFIILLFFILICYNHLRLRWSENWKKKRETDWNERFESSEINRNEMKCEEKIWKEKKVK